MGAFCPNHCISAWYLKHEPMQNFWRVHPLSCFPCRCSDNSGLWVQQLLLFLSWDTSCSWQKNNQEGRVFISVWSNADQGSPVGWGGVGFVPSVCWWLRVKSRKGFQQCCGSRWGTLGKRFTGMQPAIVHRWPLAELSHHQLTPVEMEEGGRRGSTY